MGEISELLPPLPKPVRFDYDHGADMGTPVYSEAQMRKYALDTVRRAEARQAPTDYSNLLSVITDIRERSGVGSKPMLSELADAIAERIAEPKVGDEIQFCPQCGWNSAMDATPEPLPAGAATDGLVAAVQNLLAHWDRHDGPEKRGVYNGVGYWSPAARMVDTQVIADLRAAFAARPAEPVAVVSKDVVLADLPNMVRRVRKDWPSMPEDVVRDMLLAAMCCESCVSVATYWREKAESPAAEPVAVKTYADTVAPYVAAQRMVREAIGELFGPTASIESDEAVLLRGPEPTHEAEAQIAALQRIRSALVSAPAPGLVEALLPFAKIADDYDDAEDDEFQVWQDFDVLGARLPLKHFRAARKALASITETGGAK